MTIEIPIWALWIFAVLLSVSAGLKTFELWIQHQIKQAIEEQIEGLDDE